MADFAASGVAGDDDDELLSELQDMINNDTGGPPDEQTKDISLSEEAEEKKAAEIARLERRIADWDEAEEVRQKMPAAPHTRSGGKGKALGAVSQVEKERLLASAGSCSAAI